MKAYLCSCYSHQYCRPAYWHICLKNWLPQFLPCRYVHATSFKREGWLPFPLNLGDLMTCLDLQHGAEGHCAISRPGPGSMAASTSTLSGSSSGQTPEWERHRRRTRPGRDASDAPVNNHHYLPKKWMEPSWIFQPSSGWSSYIKWP